jgi:SAM-dependent methyltransferase
MSNEQIFASIYAKGKWGNDKSKKFNSGSGSHNSTLVDPYISSLRQKFSEQGFNLSVADVGCGDFTVGIQTVEFFKNYYAIDVAPKLIQSHKENYSRDNLIFMQQDVTTKKLPNVDIVIARQCLQHLSNNQILQFLSNLPNDLRYLIVSEHVPSSSFQSNIDIQTGHETRLVKGSGVVLHEHPFNIKFTEKDIICCVEDSNGTIMTTCYENPRK